MLSMQNSLVKQTKAKEPQAFQRLNKQANTFHEGMDSSMYKSIQLKYKGLAFQPNPKLLAIQRMAEDFDQKKNKPSMRLMNEVYRVSELFQRLALVLADRPVEVHLDINPNEMHASSCVVQQAIGYIRGTCNVIPMVKPQAFAASYAADRLRSLSIAA